MAQYIEDLVQNIYTNCDTTGFEKLLQAQRDIIWYNGEVEQTFNRVSKAQKVNMSIAGALKEEQQMLNRATINEVRAKEAEAKANIRVAYTQELYAKKLARLRRQESLLTTGLRRMLLYVGGFHTILHSINTARELDLTERSITGLTKSTQDWAYIQDEAFRTANRIQDVAKGYRNFYAAASMAGFDKDTIQSLYSDVLTSTRAIGASQTQTAGALLALEQMISKGVVSMEELRRQLGNALPGAFEIGARAMNMTTKEFNDFVKTGQLASNVFIPRFVAQMKKEFGPGFKASMGSLDAAMTNLANAWALIQKGFMSGDAGRSFAKTLIELTNALTSPDFKEFMQVTSKFLGFLVSIIGWIVKNVRLLIVLLGSAGALGVMLKFKTQLTGILALTKSFFAIGIAQGVANLTTGLWAMLKPIAILYGQILLLVSALLLLEDLYTAIFHPEKNSLIRREFSGQNASWGGSGNWGFTPKAKEQIDLSKVPMSISAPSRHGLSNMFSKISSSSSTIQIGDIKVIGSNNPIETAIAVRDELIGLLTGTKKLLGEQ